MVKFGHKLAKAPKNLFTFENDSTVRPFTNNFCHLIIQSHHQIKMLQFKFTHSFSVPVINVNNYHLGFTARK